MAKKRVLILCTGNSARSQMAEGLMRYRVGDKWEVSSAGTHPKGLNPLAVEVMREIGIDISSHRSKDVQEFQGQNFDLVITVCDNAKESCPIFPGSKKLHWSTPDPETREDFRKVRKQLSSRINQLIETEERKEDGFRH